METARTPGTLNPGVDCSSFQCRRLSCWASGLDDSGPQDSTSRILDLGSRICNPAVSAFRVLFAGLLLMIFTSGDIYVFGDRIWVWGCWVWV